MPIFAKGVPPERFAQGPDLCLWRHFFHLAACPACGSIRALAAFFHGRLTAALAFNRNAVVTAPVLLALLAEDVVHLLRRTRLPRPSSLCFPSELNRVPKSE